MQKTLLFVAIILQTLYEFEYTACLDILHSVGKFTVVYKVHIYYALCNDNNVCCLCVSCFHFSVSLLHAWLFWEMTPLLCWRFTLVYRVHIHYAMATIPVACILQSLQNSNKQLYQFHQSWLTSIANCVWVKLGIARFGINAPSLWCVWCSLAVVLA